MRSLAFSLTLAVAAAANASTAWESWLRQPTPANAGRVAAIGYTVALSDAEAGPRTTRDLETLAQRVRSGEEAALRLALRLTVTTAPGANLEDLHEMLGAAVRPHARRLLIALRKTPTVHGCPGVDFLGPEFVDQPERQREETVKRRAALQSVSDPALATVRGKCLATLKDDA